MLAHLNHTHCDMNGGLDDLFYRREIIKFRKHTKGIYNGIYSIFDNTIGGNE